MMSADVASRPYVRGSSSASAIAGPMPGSTPICGAKQHTDEREQQVRRCQSRTEAVDQVVEGVHQRIPSRMPTGRLTSRPSTNRYQVPIERVKAMTALRM